MSGRVVVVGSLHLDLMVAASGLPRLGETALGEAWSMRPGGKGGNQAVAAARHGAVVAMVGLVGEDAFGERLRANLAAHGVDATHVGARAGAGSGISVAITEPGGDYGAVIVSGVNRLLDEAAVTAAAPAFEGATWVLLQNEVPEAANRAAAARARGAGARVLLNAAPARPFDPALGGLIDVLVVNALEAEALCGVIVADLAGAGRAAEALATRVPCAIVTAGPAGVACARADGPRLSLAGHAVRVVSTHGAGDTFVGALAARLAAGAGLADALARANRAAAERVSGAPRLSVDGTERAL